MDEENNLALRHQIQNGDGGENAFKPEDLRRILDSWKFEAIPQNIQEQFEEIQEFVADLEQNMVPMVAVNNINPQLQVPIDQSEQNFVSFREPIRMTERLMRGFKRMD